MNPELRDTLLRAVSGYESPCDEDDLRDVPGVIEACRAARTSLRVALLELCSEHCLQHDSAPVRSRRYWIGAVSRAPSDIPRTPLPVDASVALPRTRRVELSASVLERPTPVRADGLEFLKYPSRRGDLLHYRDGRITDLAGNLVGRRDQQSLALVG